MYPFTYELFLKSSCRSAGQKLLVSPIVDFELPPPLGDVQRRAATSLSGVWSIHTNRSQNRETSATVNKFIMSIVIDLKVIIALILAI